MKSIWNEDVEKCDFPALEEDIKTDVLVIGGGLCGILCAQKLTQSGVDCVLVEADKICNGITNGTTAKITFGHGLIYDKIIKEYGIDTARLYYESQKVACEKLMEMAEETLGFEKCASFVYSKDNKKTIEQEVKALNSIGCDAKFCQDTELPFDVAGAVKIENQARFHPLRLAYSIAKGLKIYENTKVLEIRNNVAITNRGKIRAKKIIVATHFPFINKHGGYFLKMYQHRSYVLALKGAPKIQDMYVDEEKNGLSFRSYNDLLLLGGGSHRTGSEGGNWAELRQFKEKYYPDAEEVCRWATQDCMTLDGIPYIGQYSNATPDLYVATGFNKWGMSSSMVSAMVLNDMICKGKSEYEEIYSPQRSIFHPQLAVNIFESMKGLVTPTAPRCPHLGCALKYNKQEHSWDCPCHGSRFEKDGKLINNPATDDIKSR